MKKTMMCLVAASLLGACATDPYGNNVESRTLGGVLLGGALGAAGGTAVGLDPVSGAAVGMVAGGVAGYAVKGHPTAHHRRYYRSTTGYCYYVDASGVSHYDDPPVRC